MPELPEVETVRRMLARVLPGRRIEQVIVREPRLRWHLCADTFAASLTGARIGRVRRRAKYLLVDLLPPAGPPNTLLVHLGMTGWWGLRHGPLWPHDHVICALDDASVLAFNDARRFGSLHVVPQAEEASHRLLGHLGCEPLDPQDFSASYLYAACRGRRTTIKERLMDASVVVGVGNIYASESLFVAGIHPRLPAGRLSLPRAARLVAAVRQVLGEAIALGGTSFRDFRGSDGVLGRFTERLRVYGRGGAACLACTHAITKATLGGRSTFYCTHCQRR